MISVIVPAFNIENFIGKCIESILGQSYKELEVIIVDDGSTDHTWDVISTYIPKDKRIRAFHKDNGGVSSARNLGLDVAVGEYISFIDGDDWIEPDLYEDAMRAFTQYNVDVFMFEYYVDTYERQTRHHVAHGNYGVIEAQDCLVHTIRPHNRFACSKVISKKLLSNRHDLPGHIRFNSNIIIGEDTLFIIEAIMNSGRTYYTNKAYYHYEQREGSAVRSLFNEKKLSGLEAYQRICDMLSQKGYTEAYQYGCISLFSLGVQLGKNMIRSGICDENVFKTISDYIDPLKFQVLFSRKTDLHTRLKAFGSIFSIKITCKLLARG